MPAFCIVSHYQFITNSKFLKVHHMPGCVLDMQSLPCAENRQIPAHGGGSFKSTLIKKTLSLRYFRQCQRLEESLNVAWSGQERLQKGERVRLALEGRQKEFR